MADEGSKRADRIVVGLAIYAIVLCLVIIYVLISIWPDTVPMEEGISSLAFGFWAGGLPTFTGAFFSLISSLLGG